LRRILICVDFRHLRWRFVTVNDKWLIIHLI